MHESLRGALRGPLPGGGRGAGEGEEQLHRPLMGEQVEGAGDSSRGSTGGSGGVSGMCIGMGSGSARGIGISSGSGITSGSEGPLSEAHELKQEALKALLWLRGVPPGDEGGDRGGEREEEVRREVEEMVSAVESEEEKRRVEGEGRSGEKWSELVMGNNGRALLVACGLVLFQQVRTSRVRCFPLSYSFLLQCTDSTCTAGFPPGVRLKRILSLIQCPRGLGSIECTASPSVRDASFSEQLMIHAGFFSSWVWLPALVHALAPRVRPLCRSLVSRVCSTTRRPYCK